MLTFIILSELLFKIRPEFFKIAIYSLRQLIDFDI